MASARRDPLLWAACVLLVIAMMASFTPTPLYPRYQAEWGIGDDHVSLVFAGYPIGVVLVLIGLGGLSDRLGRRNTLLLGLAVLLAAMLILGFATDLVTLVGGRIVQGAGAGLLVSSAAAALMKSHPDGPDRGSFVNTLCVSLGVAIGPFVAGSLASTSDRPLLVPYLVIAVLLLLPLAPLARSRTNRTAAGSIRVVQAVRVPRLLLRRFSVAAVAIFSTNMCFGLFGAFGPQIAHRMDWTSEAASGRLVSLTLVAVVAAQLGGRRLSRSTAMALGVVLALLGWSATAAGVASLSPVAVMLGSAVLGLGAGLCLLGSAALVGVISPPGREAEVYSAYLVVAFATLAGTALAAGPVLTRFPLTAVLVAAVVLSSLVAAWVLPGVRRMAREEFA
ncbi:MFS transporter [Micromonospora sp. CP22]|uniref:MFS transporter n=1 Tax=Micromonospora sp. CP22 TaxID=2580517 RepID=UPI0012BB995B|nr:MFS transporter [Micromonospora sp. CP22]MTK05047.1 MFS transporter [Micromonospora sp. CP22]